MTTPDPSGIYEALHAGVQPDTGEAKRLSLRFTGARIDLAASETVPGSGYEFSGDLYREISVWVNPEYHPGRWTMRFDGMARWEYSNGTWSEDCPSTVWVSNFAVASGTLVDDFLRMHPIGNAPVIDDPPVSLATNTKPGWIMWRVGATPEPGFAVSTPSTDRVEAGAALELEFWESQLAALRTRWADLGTLAKRLLAAEADDRVLNLAERAIDEMDRIKQEQIPHAKRRIEELRGSLGR